MRGPLDILLARLEVVDGLGFVRVEGLQVEELFREVGVTVKSNQVGHTLLAFAREAGLASAQTAVAL